MFDPDAANSDVPTAEKRAEHFLSPVTSEQHDLDVAELSARFTAHGAGRVSAEVSANLALEIVLNEIVEQACLATPASGAAIVLERGGEWVCRASSGSNAPRLGSKLNIEAGLSGACIRTRQVQRCNDTRSDPRVDIEACRDLGVRSVIILPLLQNDELVGAFEVFSSSPSAFGERDERTLEALSQVVLRNLARASELVTPSPTGSKSFEDGGRAAAAGGSNHFVTEPLPDSGTEYDLTDMGLPQARSNGVSLRGSNVITFVLGALVFVAAVLLTVVAGQRLVGRRFAVRSRTPATVSVLASSAGNQTPMAASSGRGAAAPSTSAGQANASKPSGVPPSGTPLAAHDPAVAQTRGSSPPAGSLLVYQNGKEIFRMPPAVETDDATNSTGSHRAGTKGTAPVGAQAPSGLEPAAIYELSPEAAEGSVVHRVEPDYPEQARQQEIEGPVVLDVRASRDGSVQEVKLLSGQPLLADAAIAAVKQWRFRARKVNGQPVEMETRVTLDFRLPH